jgi:segregation and condensation protein B
MDREQIKKITDAILFANGEPVEASKISEILMMDKEDLIRIIDEYIEELKDSDRGILIKKINDSYQMCTNPKYYPMVRQLYEKKKTETLSRAAYETLAIIAYNKEATRAKIESVRGNSDSPLKTLLERGLVIEAGRLEAPGRPVLYKPAEEFYRAFNVSTLDDLIPIDNLDEDASTVSE